MDREHARLGNKLGDWFNIFARIVRQAREQQVLIARGPPMLTPRVELSGVAFATMSVPRLPLTPGLFSTTNALAGYFCCRPSATRRATTSGVDPGPKGTTIRTVFLGQSCAGAADPRASRARSVAKACFAARNATSAFIEGELCWGVLHWLRLSSTAATVESEL